MIRLKNNNEDSLDADLRIDLTSLLDVMFMLLMFLILTANMAASSLDIQLPKADTSQARAADGDGIRIGLRDASRWDINGQSYDTWPAVQTALRQQLSQQPQARLIIASDAQAPVQSFLDLMLFLQNQGVTSSRVLIQPHTNP